MRAVIIALLFFTVLQETKASDTSRSISVKAHFLTTDESGNAYVVRNDNVLVRYNESGDSTGFYNSVLNGEIGSVDALNPLRIFVYYPDYSSIVWLDRTLNPQGEADLRKLNIPAGALAAPSSDNNIWVYDSYTATLRKIDETGLQQKVSNDLRQQLGYVPQGVQLLERERKVFLVDTAKGILVFDQFGSYLEVLPVTGVKVIQVFKNGVGYLKEGFFHLYDLKDFTDMSDEILHGKSNALIMQITRSGIWSLYSNHLLFASIKDPINRGNDE